MVLGPEDGAGAVGIARGVLADVIGTGALEADQRDKERIRNEIRTSGLSAKQVSSAFGRTSACQLARACVVLICIRRDDESAAYKEIKAEVSAIRVGSSDGVTAARDASAAAGRVHRVAEAAADAHSRGVLIHGGNTIRVGRARQASEEADEALALARGGGIIEAVIDGGGEVVAERSYAIHVGHLATGLAPVLLAGTEVIERLAS